jgi:hypothetical protein
MLSLSFEEWEKRETNFLSGSVVYSAQRRCSCQSVKIEEGAVPSMSETGKDCEIGKKQKQKKHLNLR